MKNFSLEIEGSSTIDQLNLPFYSSAEKHQLKVVQDLRLSLAIPLPRYVGDDSNRHPMMRAFKPLKFSFGGRYVVWFRDLDAKRKVLEVIFMSSLLTICSMKTKNFKISRFPFSIPFSGLVRQYFNYFCTLCTAKSILLVRWQQVWESWKVQNSRPWNFNRKWEISATPACSEKVRFKIVVVQKSMVVGSW